MLVIRFYRTGKKNQPSYKIIVSDKRRSSKRVCFTEVVGFWNPLTKEKVLKQDRIKYWISVGAKPSETVHNLLVSEKIIEGKKIPLHKKSKKKAEAPKEEAKQAVPEVKAAAAEVKPVETPKPEPEAPKEEAKLAEPSFAKATEGEGKKEAINPPEEKK